MSYRLAPPPSPRQTYRNWLVLSQRYNGPPPQAERTALLAGGRARQNTLRRQAQSRLFDALARRTVAEIARWRRCASATSPERVHLAARLQHYRTCGLAQQKP